MANYEQVNLSWQEELDDDPKASQQVEFVGQLKKLDNDFRFIESLWHSWPNNIN